jgi:hypothetical protein
MDDEEKTMCEDCGEQEATITTVEGKEVCEDCANENYTKCEDCGDYTDDPVTTAKGKKICQTCMEDNYQSCEDCGDLHHEDDLYEVKDQYGKEQLVCKSCHDNNIRYKTCDICGERVHRNFTSRIYDDDVICDDCKDNGDWYCCDDCGHYVHSDYVHFFNNEDSVYCPNCYEEHEYETIQEYDYEPYHMSFFPADADKRTTVFAGIELEIDDGGCDDYNAKQIGKVANEHVYFKHDGSLDDGFEIVTYPATFEYHLTKFPWDSILAKTKALGYTSHDNETCGLHVHFSRRALGENEEARDLVIAKVLLFFEHNWGNIVKFSRRTMSQISEWANRYGKEPDEGAIELLNKAKSSGKYFAVNLEHDATVEIRIFRGTLIKDTLFATIQFVDCLVELAKEIDLEEFVKVSFEHIVERAKQKGYKELLDEIEKRGIDPKTWALSKKVTALSGAQGEEELPSLHQVSRQSHSMISFAPHQTVRIVNVRDTGLSENYVGMLGEIERVHTYWISMKTTSGEFLLVLKENLEIVEEGSISA